MVAKRGQVTLFLIIGIIVLMGVGLWMFMGGEDNVNSDGRSLGTDAEETGEKDSEKKILQTYIQSCFEDTTDQALLLFGKQGGYIYKSQGGIDDDFSDNQEGKFFVYHDQCQGGSCMVPYWIKNSRLGKCDDPYSACPYSKYEHDYPWKRFPYKDVDGNHVHDLETEKVADAAIFGNVLAPPLHENQGAGSIEGKLKAYIVNNIDECLGTFEDFGEIYDITHGEVVDGVRSNASVLLTRNDFRVTLYYPITFTKGDKKYAFNKFSYKIGVRLKRIYDAIVTVSKHESVNPEFNVVIDGERYINNQDSPETEEFYLQGKGQIRVYSGNDRYDEVEMDYYSKQDFFHDDIIEIVDDESKIKKEEYVWRFVRQNRAPALYYVHDQEHGGIIDQNSNIEIASVSSDGEFEEIWIDGVQEGSLGGLDWYYYDLLYPKQGNAIEYHSFLENEMQKAFLFVPEKRFNMFDDADELAYPNDRQQWLQKLEAGDDSDFLFVHQIQAVDPDEEIPLIGVNTRDWNTDFTEEGYVVQRKDCCDGYITVRVNATDESGLMDKQDVKFIINSQTDEFDGMACGYESYQNCANNDEAPLVVIPLNPQPPEPEEDDPNKPNLHILSVAMNYNGYDGQVGGHTNIEFAAHATELFNKIEEWYGDDYNVNHIRITDPSSKVCPTGLQLSAWVLGFVGADLVPGLESFINEADVFITLGMDNQPLAENPGCICNQHNPSKTMYIDGTFCSHGDPTAYFNAFSGKFNSWIN